MLLGTSIYAGDDITQEKATTRQENMQEATSEFSPHASLKQMSTFFEEFDKLFEQRMHELNQEMSGIENNLHNIGAQQKQAPRFSITESPSKDGTHLVVKAVLPGFTREEIQVKFITTQEQDNTPHKTLEITAEHKTQEPPTTVKQTKATKGRQVVAESIIKTHHVFASSSYENGRERKISCEDDKVKILYDLPDTVDLENMGAIKDTDYITLEKEVLSIMLPVMNK
jgi:HSP20 family molecular chaperone IbpA